MTHDDPAASPDAVPMPPPRSEAASPDRAGLFARFVAAEDDVVGLLAYALHRQNRQDWLEAFWQQAGREPDARESSAFRVGEGIERRLAGYRAQAERMLEARLYADKPAMPPLAVVPASPVEDETATGLARSPVSSATNPPSRVDPALARKKIVAGLVVFVLLVAGVIIARRTMGV